MSSNEMYSWDYVGEWNVAVEVLEDCYEGIGFKTDPVNPKFCVYADTGEEARQAVFDLIKNEEDRE